MEADLEEPISIIFPVAVTLQNESERMKIKGQMVLVEG
jgi:hypothetical protein